MFLPRRQCCERVFNFNLQRLANVCRRDFFPVDDAVNEIDGVIVRRIGQQNAAVHEDIAAIVHKLGFEADGRVVGNDLTIMFGNARQERMAGHFIQISDVRA